MIPTITPPTDSLYKFISLFGLTIFLFSAYNLGIVFDRSAQVRMELEDLKFKFIKKIYIENSLSNEQLVKNSSTTGRFRNIRLKLLNSDITAIEKEIDHSGLLQITRIELKGEISKMRLNLDSIRLKLYSCLYIAIFGFLIVIFGFLRWKMKEQNIRDKMLEIEHILKQQERDTKRKHKKKKKAIQSSMQELEQRQAENEETQNQTDEITSSSMN